MAPRPETFGFSAKAWITSKKRKQMTLEQQGMYANLLAQAWDWDPFGYLPDDDNELWDKAGCKSLEQWLNGGSAIVKAAFNKVEIDGRILLITDRMDSERRKALGWSEKSSEGGKKSGESRRMMREEIKELSENHRFVPPTVSQVADFMREKGYFMPDPQSEAESFVACHTRKGWFIGPRKMSSWKAAVVYWHSNRFRYGQTNGNGAAPKSRMQKYYDEHPDKNPDRQAD